jgi:hypothetical protein
VNFNQKLAASYMIRHMRLALLLALLLAGSASAATLYQVTGPEGVPWNADTVQVLYGSWTQSTSFTNVDISALLLGSGTASAVLTDQIGPGTTVGNVIASTTVSYPATSTLTSLFTGLSLGSGTYYLIIGGTGAGAWPQAGPSTVTTAAGVSANGYGFCSDSAGPCDYGFLPDSPFQVFDLESQFLVTGDAPGVPEPSTAATAAVALLALAVCGRLRRRSGPASAPHTT